MWQPPFTRTKEVDDITPALRSLHRLPVCQRTDVRILLLVYKALNGLRPKHISDPLLCYEPYRPLRWSGTSLLSVPGVRAKHGEAAFSSFTRHTSGINSQDTAGLLRLSPLLTQGWGPLCLLLPFHWSNFKLSCLVSELCRTDKRALARL